MLQNVTGQEVDYDLFKNQFDTTPQLKSLVKRFDGQGIIIKTKKEAGELDSIPGEKSTGSVDSSAKRAAAATLKRVG